MLIVSVSEVVSVGAVLPFLGVLTGPERVFNHPFVQPFVEWAGFTHPRNLILPLTIIFSIAALFSGAARLLLLWAQTRLSYAIGADLSLSMYRRTLYQDYLVHATRNSSEVIAGISIKAKIVVGYSIFPSITIVSSGLILIAILAVFAMVEPVIAFSTFAGFGLVYALVVVSTKKKLARDSRRISYEQNQVVKVLQEGLGGIRDVLIDGTQAVYCNAYQKADLPLRDAQASVQIISGSPRYVIEAFGMVFIAVLAFSLAEDSEGISNAIPILGALALGAQRLLPVLQQAYSSWTAIRGGQVSLSDALDLLDQPLPEYADAPLVSPIPFDSQIALDNISFRYSKDGPCALEGVSLSIQKGARIGFVGATGSGKSTLLDIIMGLLQPTKGNLLIDGRAVALENHRAWQAHIAHVPQSIFLADTSIAENIAFGVPFEQIDFGRVREVAEKAQIAQVIEAWDDQYNTLVGERGIRLSGGQRQRIGIARALYKRANVIVLDEATSALDNDTERVVMQEIESLGSELTILIVAHRLSTLKNCTEVIELADGRVLRRGSFSEIIGASI